MEFKNEYGDVRVEIRGKWDKTKDQENGINEKEIRQNGYRKIEELKNPDVKNSSWYFKIRLGFGKYFVGSGYFGLGKVRLV